MIEFGELTRSVKKSTLLPDLYSELCDYKKPVDPKDFEHFLARRMHEEMGYRYLKTKLIKEKRASQVYSPSETASRFRALFGDVWTPQGEVVMKRERLEEWIAFCFYHHFWNPTILRDEFHTFMGNRPSDAVHLMFIVPSDLQERAKHPFVDKPVEVIPVPYTSIQIAELAQDAIRTYRPKLNSPSFAKLIAEKNQGRKYSR